MSMIISISLNSVSGYVSVYPSNGVPSNILSTFSTAMCSPNRCFISFSICGGMFPSSNGITERTSAPQWFLLWVLEPYASS